MLEIKIDEKDKEILRILQSNCRMSTKAIANKLNMPVTTLYSKIKRLEHLKVIKAYNAILDKKKLGKGVTAFLLVSFYYKNKERGNVAHHELAEKIARFPEVQEVHFISGNWDILVKIVVESVDAVGKFVIERLRTLEGVEKSITMVVFDSKKETLEINI